MIEAVKLREALTTPWRLVRDSNAYLDKRAPWKTIKEDSGDAARSVYTVLRVIDNLKMLLSPFLPFTSQKVHEFLGYDGQLFGDLSIVEYQESDPPAQGADLRRQQAPSASGRKATSTGASAARTAPLIVKLEPEIVDNERAYLGAPRDEHEIVV